MKSSDFTEFTKEISKQFSPIYVSSFITAPIQSPSCSMNKVFRSLEILEEFHSKLITIILRSPLSSCSKTIAANYSL